MITANVRSVFMQVVVGIVAALCAVSSGLTLGFSAISLQPLREANGTDHLDEDEASWFASISSIATPVGCLLSGPLLDGLGRKRTMMALNAPFLLGWVLLAAAPSTSSPVAQLYTGRVLTGFASGIASIPATVYLAEMAQPSLRGMLVTWASLSISVGILVVYLLGSVLQGAWRITAAICGVVPVVNVILVLLILPESPVWLLRKGRRQEAERAMRWLRGIPKGNPTPGHVTHEIEKMAIAGQNENEVHGALANVRFILQQLRRPEAWKPLIVMNGFFFFQQVTGIYVVVYYAVDIVGEAGVSIDPYLATVLLGLVQVVGALGVGFALNRCGRRPLSILSGIGQAVCMVALGLYLQFADTKNSSLTWVPLVAMLIYVIAGSIGFHTLPWAMLGEVFPSRIRGIAAGSTTCVAYIYSFVMLKIYPNLVEGCRALSEHSSSEGLFYFFGITSVIAAVFVWLWLPETHGKTLQQIEMEFAGIANPPDMEKEQVQNQSVKM
ncbi:facilitated trehalose transporter Tret1 [Anabrus simplex]|uniref:facilitated trehalose transporter Tret1 n=1 Tax=Anabrus simplex TaxID=316456 RepID=UPI0035A33317